MGKNSYQQSGVNVGAGDALVDWLQESSPAGQGPVPHQNRILEGIGGFASLFDIRFPEMKEPTLVTCTDGVGTKVKLASYFGRYREVAQDCVAMCVNDLICTGGSPLLFLDYYATGKLDLAAAKEFLSGLREACHRSSCALVGGETAEMPGVYSPGDFDVAGFAVGVVDAPQRWGAHRVQAGDRVLGISSSGFHSNGFSLLRQLFAADLDRWKEDLLRPTALYAGLAESWRRQKIDIHAVAHITGGGMQNVPRVLPPNLHWEAKSWPLPVLFQEVQRRSGLSSQEMLDTFNCGVGLVVILPPDQAALIESSVRNFGHECYPLGDIR